MFLTDKKEERIFSLRRDFDSWIRDLPPAEVGRRLVEENLGKERNKEKQCQK
jgi:hypothetical protein